MSRTDPFSSPDRQFPSLTLRYGNEELDPDALLPFATLGADEGWLHDILSWACSQPDLSAARYCYSLGHELARARRHRAAWLALETTLTVCYQQTPPAPGLSDESLDALAELLDDIVDAPGAIQYFERALTLWRAVRGESDPQVAEILNNLGYLYKRASRLDQAQDCYEEALAIWQEVLDPQHPYMAAVLNNLGAVARAAGRPREARQHYEKALAISRVVRGNSNPATGALLGGLGAACQDEGDDGAAARYLTTALSILESAGQAATQDLAAASNNMGHLLLGRGEYDRARRLFLRALALYDKAGTPAPLEMACVLNNLGVLYHVAGKTQAALGPLSQSYALRYRLLGPQHPHTAETLHMLQQTYTLSGAPNGDSTSTFIMPVASPN